MSVASAFLKRYGLEGGVAHSTGNGNASGIRREQVKSLVAPEKGEPYATHNIQKAPELARAEQEERRASIARSMQRVMSLGQVGPERRSLESVAHDLIARVQPKANPVPKTVRTGTHQRHMQRGNFSLMVRREFDPAVFVAEVISHIPDGKLATQMGARICPGLMISLFETLDPDSFSAIPPVMYRAREHVYELLGSHADVIGAKLLLAKYPSVFMITSAMETRDRIAKLFADEGELRLLEEKLSVATKCPGWLPIENSERLLAEINGHGKLTFEKTQTLQVPLKKNGKQEYMSLFSFLQQEGAAIFKHMQALAESERTSALPMSLERIGRRILDASATYPMPRSASLYNYTASAGSSVVFKTKRVRGDPRDEELYRSIIVMFPPLGLEVTELPDGILVAVSSGDKGGVILKGLSREEQDFLLPKYKVRVQEIRASRGIDPVEVRRQKALEEVAEDLPVEVPDHLSIRV